jgi:hypothetical protein
MKEGYENRKVSILGKFSDNESFNTKKRYSIYAK